MESIVQDESKKISDKVLKRALRDKNVMVQLLQTLNQQAEQQDGDYESEEKRSSHSSYTSQESEESEEDNNTILEAPSMMEQTQYDDGASSAYGASSAFGSRSLTRKLTFMRIQS